MNWARQGTEPQPTGGTGSKGSGTAAYQRAGQIIDGPAIVEERESTTVLHRGDRLAVDANGCLLIDVALPKFDGP